MGMADIGGKKTTRRQAVAEARLLASPETIALIKKKAVPKGDVLEAARIAGILAAKKTPELIPLCHPIPVDSVEIEFFIGKGRVNIRTTVKGRAKTGFEMEALTACAIAALTMYDMCKPHDKKMVISEIRLLKKSGGKSGTYIWKKPQQA